MRNPLVVIATLLNLVSLNAIPEQLTPVEPDPNICKAIKTLNPDLDDTRINGLSRSIAGYSLEYAVDWRIVVVILKQESNFNYKAINYDSKDFGIGQLNYRTIKERGIDLGTLLTNETYALKQTYKLLYELKVKYAKIDTRNGQKWFTRYHSSTPEFRTVYGILLKNHMIKVEKIGNGIKRYAADRLRKNGTRGTKAFSQKRIRRASEIRSRTL